MVEQGRKDFAAQPRAILHTIPIIRNGGWKPPALRGSEASNGGVRPLGSLPPRGPFGQPAPQPEAPEPPNVPHKIFPFSGEYSYSDPKAGTVQGRSWKFTDHRKGIRFEGLVGGTDVIMDILSQKCHNGGDGFRLEFSDKAFPGYEHRAKRVREEEKTWSGPAGHSSLSHHEEVKGDADFSGFMGHMPASCIPESVIGPKHKIGFVPLVPSPAAPSSAVPRSGWARGKSWKEQVAEGPKVLTPVSAVPVVVPGGPGPVQVTESGNTYRFHHQGKTFDGWLCPALFKYFNQAPAELFIRASTLTPAQQAAVALSA